jgi:hypothetical protein
MAGQRMPLAAARRQGEKPPPSPQKGPVVPDTGFVPGQFLIFPK